MDTKETITVRDEHLRMAILGEDHKEIQIQMLEDHLMTKIALDDRMETGHHLEDHLLEDRQDRNFQIQVHQVHQESLRAQQTTDDVDTSQIDVFET